MRIPKQRFVTRFRWQLIGSFLAVAILAGAWTSTTLGSASPNEARAGSVVVAKLPVSPLTAIDSPAGPSATVKATANQPVSLPKRIVPTEASIPNLDLFVDPTFLANGYLSTIASQPLAHWYGGWSGDITAAVGATVTAASAMGKAPVLVAYNIPSRDCGSYSAGGAAEASSYRAWIQGFASGIGQRKAVVILEPDALAGMGCLDSAGQQSRLSLLADAVTTLKSQTGASVYLDAGNARWQSAKTMTSRLEAANIGMADGFSLNVSNFISTSESERYGDELAQYVGKRYVIDTSRNGNGAAPNNEWCNPSGRALGARPTTRTGQRYVDAFLWIKTPGESDGTCNGGPNAGVWWPSYAQQLVQNSN